MGYMEEVFQRAERQFTSVQSQIDWLSGFERKKGAYSKKAVEVRDELVRATTIKQELNNIKKTASYDELRELKNDAQSLHSSISNVKVGLLREIEVAMRQNADKLKEQLEEKQKKAEKEAKKKAAEELRQKQQKEAEERRQREQQEKEERKQKRIEILLEQKRVRREITKIGQSLDKEERRDVLAALQAELRDLESQEAEL